MSSCCSTSPFNTPSAGNVLVVPPGSQVIATPTLGCGGEVGDAIGSVEGASSASGALISAFSYPKVETSFTMPAIGSSGSFYSENAGLWAVVGALAWLAPLGHVQITGISGKLVSFTNLSVVQGVTVNAGATIIVTAPPAPSGAAIPADGSKLTRVRGFDGIEERLLAGISGQLLRHDGTGWKPYSGKTYLSLDEAVDITPSGFSPVPTNSALTVAIPLNLPGLPTPLPPVFHADLTLVLAKSATSVTTIERQGRILVGGTYGTAGTTYAASCTIRCTNSTPQLTLNKTASATGITLKVFVNGYYV